MVLIALFVVTPAEASPGMGDIDDIVKLEKVSQTDNTVTAKILQNDLPFANVQASCRIRDGQVQLGQQSVISDANGIIVCSGDFSKATNVDISAYAKMVTFDYDHTTTIEEIIETISDVTTTVTEQVAKTAVQVSKNLDKPSVVTTTSSVAVVTTTASVATGAIGLAAAQLSLKDFFLMILNYLFTLFAIKKKTKFGIVFDASTDKPIQGAVVQLYEAKSLKLISTALSDKKGRYIFSAKEGEYTMSVIKPGYLFPSKMINGNSRFYNSYVGQNFAVTQENPAINYLIPIDPDANAVFHAGLVYRVVDSISFRYAMLMFGTGVALYSLVQSPWPWGYMSSSSFLILWLIELFVQNRIVKYSKVIDKTNKSPLSLALVRVVNDEGKLVETFVTDQHGRVLPNITDHRQKILVEKTGYRHEEFAAEKQGLVERKKFYLDKTA